MQMLGNYVAAGFVQVIERQSDVSSAPEERRKEVWRTVASASDNGPQQWSRKRDGAPVRADKGRLYGRRERVAVGPFFTPRHLHALQYVAQNLDWKHVDGYGRVALYKERLARALRDGQHGGARSHNRIFISAKAGQQCISRGTQRNNISPFIFVAAQGGRAGNTRCERPELIDFRRQQHVPDQYGYFPELRRLISLEN